MKVAGIIVIRIAKARVLQLVFNINYSLASLFAKPLHSLVLKLDNRTNCKIDFFNVDL